MEELRSIPRPIPNWTQELENQFCEVIHSSRGQMPEHYLLHYNWSLQQYVNSGYDRGILQ